MGICGNSFLKQHSRVANLLWMKSFFEDGKKKWFEHERQYFGGGGGGRGHRSAHKVILENKKYFEAFC